MKSNHLKSDYFIHFTSNVNFTTVADHQQCYGKQAFDNKTFPQKTHNLWEETCPRFSVIFCDECLTPRTKCVLRVSRPVDGPHSKTVKSWLLLEEPAHLSAVLLLHWQEGLAVHVTQFISGSKSNAMEVMSGCLCASYALHLLVRSD